MHAADCESERGVHALDVVVRDTNPLASDSLRLSVMHKETDTA